MDHQPIKRLRFSYDPDARESVAGALAAACREHRLHRINSALEGGGIALSRIGSIQCAPPETIEHLARIMRTDATLIAAIAFTRSERRDRIVMGDLIAPRSVFDFERRWIGPISLGDEPFHRSAWLNRMLPYCPKSLELLVNACPTCGPLGWRTTRGIGFCEECREPIPPSTELPLPKTLADDYRLFADLMSRDAAVGAVAVHRLPDGIRSYSRTTLTGVAVRASIVSASGRGRWGVEKLVEQHPGMVATISATAAALLREWPKSVQRSIDARLAEIPGDLVAYEKLRRDIRWIANGSGEEGKQLVANAFPDIDGRKVRTFAKETRHYTATQAHTKLWTSSQELAVLRRADALRWDELPGGRRKRVRYDAHDVDELALLLLQSMSPEAVASRFEVPVYAVGQMLVFQLLIAQGHPGVLLLRGQQLDAAFLDAFAGRLDAAAIRAKPPQGFLPLRRAMARYPGEKRWGRVLDALLTKRIPFHIDGPRPATARNMHVDPSSLPALPLLDWERGDDVLNLTHVSMRDAGEILGAGFDETAVAIASFGIEIIQHGRGKGVSREAVQRLAGLISFTQEAALFSNRTAVGLYHQLKRDDASRLHGAWSRRALIERGLVSGLRCVARSETPVLTHSAEGELVEAT